MSLCLRGRLNPVLWSFDSNWWGSNPRSSDHSCVRSSDHSCVKLMASYHEIASRSCDTYVGEFSYSRSCDRPPPFLYDFWISCVEFWNFFFTYFCDFYWYDLSIFVRRWIRVSLTGFLEMISRICVSPIFVISIDKFYQYVCIGEFVCHWLLWLTLI